MATVATFQSVTPAARPHKTRKRAPKACLSCRARKVRCDVSQRGRPCMNCYLDSETCIVTSRASRFRKGEKEANGENQTIHSIFPTTEECDHEGPLESAAEPRVNGEAHASGTDHTNSFRIGDTLNTTGYPGHENGIQDERAHERRPSYAILDETSKSMFSQPMNTPRPFNNNLTSTPMPGFVPLGTPEAPLWPGEQQVVPTADITYSYYPFLTISNFHNIMPQDVNHLELQGCLRIPTRAILDEFVQQYFLHVHPLLPVINEGDFWSLYFNQGNGTAPEKMSLLVFQAMLFSCCNYVSKSSIKALGFSNYRTARATLYRRTKLLFDFDTESSLVCLSQTALLLTYWVPNWSLATKKSSTAWLGVAIQNAKSAEAHIYSAMPPFCPITDPIEYKKQNTLKRLWWCCVIRDRLISLGMRRSIQVSRAHFDVDSNTGLGFPDLGDEVEHSKVYNSETKRRLIEIFTQLGELCSVLTDLLTLVFPLNDVPGWSRYNGPEGAEKIRQSKTALRKWYNTAILRFPMSRRAPDDKRYHDSVILYTNLMYMFYHSARAALCHHEVLQTAISTSPGLSISNIYESRHELKDAACGVTECLNELIQRGLARWLPISAISCTAMPLVLHIIDVKLSSQNKQKTPEERRETALKQHRLNILIEAMKTYQPQYDGVDYISETIRHIVNLAQIDPPCNSNTGVAVSNQEYGDGKTPVISDWTDILASQPDSYLRLSMTMDISISKGRLARETDFPVKLRGLFAQGFSPIRALLAGNRPKPQTRAPDPDPDPGFSFARRAAPSDDAEVFVPNSTPQIQLGSVHSVSSDEGSASPEPAPHMAEGPASGAAVDDGNRNNEQMQRQPSSMFSSSPLFDGSGHLTSDTDIFGHNDPMGMGMGMNLEMGLDDIDYALNADALTAYVLQRDDEKNRDVPDLVAVDNSDGTTTTTTTSTTTSPEQQGNNNNHHHTHTHPQNNKHDEMVIDNDIDMNLSLGNWIDQVWGEEDRRLDLDLDANADPDADAASDKETARVLLEAMRDG